MSKPTNIFAVVLLFGITLSVPSEASAYCFVSGNDCPSSSGSRQVVQICADGDGTGTCSSGALSVSAPDTITFVRESGGSNALGACVYNTSTSSWNFHRLINSGTSTVVTDSSQPRDMAFCSGTMMDRLYIAYWNSSCGGTSTTAWSYGGYEMELYGQEGYDDLYGGSGSDLLCGGGDDDELYGYSGTDDLDGMAGDDYLEGNTGNDELWGYSGVDDIADYSGYDYLFGEDGSDACVYDYDNSAGAVDCYSPAGGSDPYSGDVTGNLVSTDCDTLRTCRLY